MIPGRRRPVGLGPSALGVALALACGAPSIRERGPLERDDLVVIVVDTLRADHLGAWGYAVSPVLDRLAAAGIRFENFYTTSSWTRPAMATLHTGLYARSVGIYEERYDELPADVVTLPERLREAGYVTLGLTANPNVNTWFGFDQGFVEYVDSDVVSAFMPVGQGQERFHIQKAPLAAADEVSARTLALVDAHAEELSRSPLYLQVLYVDPHYPYAPPGAHRRAVGGGDDVVSLYDGEIHFVDAEIGRLLEGQERRGLLEHAFVLVTSDHGEGLGDHPELPGGRVLGQLASSIDLAPTLLDAAGIEWDPGELPGSSLLPLLRGAGAGPGDRVFSETDWRYANKVSVRTATHQYVRNDDSAAYQREGAYEGRRLDPRRQQVLERIPPEEFLGTRDESGLWDELVASLQRWEAATPRRAPQRRDPADVLTLGDGTQVPTGGGQHPVVELDPAQRRQLEALGYLEDESS